MLCGRLVNLLLGLQKDGTMNPVSQLFDFIYENSKGIKWHTQTPKFLDKISPLV